MTTKNQPEEATKGPEDVGQGVEDVGQGDTADGTQGAEDGRQDGADRQGDQDGGDKGGQDDVETLRSMVRSARKDAASWRTKVKGLEAERDALTEQVSKLRLAAVAKVGGLPDAGVLTRAGVDIAELVDESGHVDERAVRQAVADVRKSLGMDVNPDAARWPRGGGLSGADYGGTGRSNPIADALTAGPRRP